MALNMKKKEEKELKADKMLQEAFKNEDSKRKTSSDAILESLNKGLSEKEESITVASEKIAEAPTVKEEPEKKPVEEDSSQHLPVGISLNVPDKNKKKRAAATRAFYLPDETFDTLCRLAKENEMSNSEYLDYLLKQLFQLK